MGSAALLTAPSMTANQIICLIYNALERKKVKTSTIGIVYREMLHSVGASTLT